MAPDSSSPTDRTDPETSMSLMVSCAGGIRGAGCVVAGTTGSGASIVDVVVVSGTMGTGSSGTNSGVLASFSVARATGAGSRTTREL